MIYDAIVAGLGPAGATAAFELSKKGFNVLAIEKASMPRYKPCGGALSAKIEKILDIEFKQVVERNIHGLCLNFQGNDEIHSFSERPICYMVMRDRFDHYLAKKAELSGANIVRERLLKVKEQNGKVEVTTDRGHHCAQKIIGADGAGSTVAKDLGLKPGNIFAKLVEGEVKVKANTLEKVAGEIFFEFGSVPHGYGWAFPKADHLSVGVGGIMKSLKNPIPYYTEFLTKCVPEITDSLLIRRYIIPVFNGKSKISSDHCFLTGDAAALVDPFIGEGIYYAIKSSQIAAEVLAEGRGADVYEKKIADEIYSEFRFARKVGTLFYNFPEWTFKLLKHNPGFIKKFFELSRGDIGYQELWKRVKNKVTSEPAIFSGLKSVPKVLKEII